MSRILKIANCKLKIANCRMGHCERLGKGRPSAGLLRPARTSALPRRLSSPICNLQFAICNLQFLFLVLFGSLAFSADPPPSTDDQLRDSLNSKTDDDYDRALLGDPAKPDDKSRVDEKMQEKLQKELGSAAKKEGKDENPLLQVAKEMREVQQRIGRRDSGQDTQQVQRQIVADLAKLIEEAKKSGSCDGKPSQSRKTAGSPKKPGQDSTQPSGNSPAPAERSDPRIRKPEEIRTAAKNEAHQRMLESIHIEMQRHPREQMFEEPGEYFLPEYELEIEDYFRRLSEDQPGVGKP